MKPIKNHFHSNHQEILSLSGQAVSDKSSTKILNWSTLISEWEKCSQTKLEFCRLNGLNYNTFMYQYRKSSKKVEKSSKLLPVRMHADNPLSLPQSMAYFTLDFPNGTQLAIPEHANPSTLKLLLSMLGEQ